MPHNIINLVGRTFGHVTVVALVGYKHRRTWWICRCDCGNEKEFRGDALQSGNTASCGCHSRDTQFRVTHGQGHGSRTYRSYQAAKTRCQNPNATGYDKYGQRGIEFRFTSFEEFLQELGERPKGKTLDRINNDGHYEKGNVRWATPKEQARNRRNPWITRRANAAVQ